LYVVATVKVMYIQDDTRTTTTTALAHSALQ